MVWKVSSSITTCVCVSLYLKKIKEKEQSVNFYLFHYLIIFVEILWHAAIYVAEDDIASYTIKTIDDERTLNKTLYIRPPQNILSQRQVVHLWENLIAKQLHKITISKQDFLASMKGNLFVHLKFHSEIFFYLTILI